MPRMRPLIAFTGLAVFVVFASLSAQAQMQEASAAQNPCQESNELGRPTLRRRNPGKVTSPNESVRVDVGGCPEKVNPMNIQFVGLHTFTEAHVLRTLREEGVGRPDRWDSEVAAKASATVRKMLESKGYMYATVESTSDSETKSITFIVNEGTRLPLAAIRFYDGQLVAPTELETQTRQCLSRLGDSGGYEEGALEYCVRDVIGSVSSQGYLQAKYESFKKEITTDGIVVSINFAEGPLFRLGEVKIEGADHISAKRLREMLPLQSGDIVDHVKMSTWLFEDLKKAYGELGYIEYTAEPGPEFMTSGPNLKEGIVNFKVFIEEGSRFRLGAIRLRGEDLPVGLLNYPPLQPGDIYRSSALAEFVDRLNKLELFEPIDKDKDADFGTNDEEALVFITLNLKRRSR